MQDRNPFFVKPSLQSQAASPGTDRASLQSCLINAGMPQQQTEVLAASQLRLMETTLVTKQDLKQELKDLEAAIISKINDKIDSKIERAIVVIISIVAAIATLTTIIIAFLS